MTNSERHIGLINAFRRHGLPLTVEKTLIAFEQAKGLKERNIIELGAMIPTQVSGGVLGVNSWISVLNSSNQPHLGPPDSTRHSSPPVHSYQNERHTHLDWLRELEAIPKESVDAVFSFDNLHEFGDLGYLLDLIFEVLKPGGTLHLSTTSIWTGPNGHNLPPTIDSIGRTISAESVCLPQWCHLLWTKHHLYRELSKTMDLRTAATICHQVYDSSRINRFMTTDYLAALEHSKFDLNDNSSQVHLASQPMPRDIKTFLSQKYPQESHLETVALRIELEKPGRTG